VKVRNEPEYWYDGQPDLGMGRTALIESLLTPRKEGNVLPFGKNIRSIRKDSLIHELRTKLR